MGIPTNSRSISPKAASPPIPAAAVAMASAFLVSYARAKSEGLGFTQGTGMAEVGLAPREIRLVILAIGIVAAGLAGGVAPATDVLLGMSSGQLWMAAGLGLIAILATITVIQRVLHVRAQARKTTEANRT